MNLLKLQFKAIVQLFLPTDKQDQEKRIPWLENRRSFNGKSTKQMNGKELFPEQFNNYGKRFDKEKAIIL